MEVSERTLKRWRKESLKIAQAISVSVVERHKPVTTNRATMLEWQKRILTMTQELLDQHMLRRK